MRLSASPAAHVLTWCLTSAPGRIRTRDPLLRRSFRAGVNLCVSRSAVIRVVLE